jgi:hypothetical protein
MPHNVEVLPPLRAPEFSLPDVKSLMSITRGQTAADLVWNFYEADITRFYHRYNGPVAFAMKAFPDDHEAQASFVFNFLKRMDGN